MKKKQFKLQTTLFMAYRVLFGRPIKIKQLQLPDAYVLAKLQLTAERSISMHRSVATSNQVSVANTANTVSKNSSRLRACNSKYCDAAISTLGEID